MAEFMLKTENRYSGIPTIRREMKKAGLPDPVFQDRRNEFVVTLYNQSRVNLKLNEKGNNTQDILSFCSIPRSRKELAHFLGLESVSYAITQYIQPLVDQGALRLTIPERPKSTHQKYVTAEDCRPLDF